MNHPLARRGRGLDDDTVSRGPDVRSLMARPPVVVLGGSFHALSVARSLGPYGVDVHLLGHGRGLPGVERSRWITSFDRAPDGTDPVARWRRWFDDRPGGWVVLPASDEGVEFLAQHGAELRAEGWLTIEHDPEVLGDMLNKERTYELADAAGVPAPRVFVAGSLADARAAAHEVGFPCALKPTTSHTFARSQAGAFAGKGAIVEDDFALRRAYEQLAGPVPLLLTELITGADDTYCSYFSYLDEDGQPLVHVTKRKLRQYPIGFGLGTYHATAWEPEAAELGARFFQAVGIRGVGNVEFKRCSRTGRLVLIECNARITAADSLLRRAGVQLVELAYERALGRRGHPSVPVPAPDFREGLTMWLPGRDLRAARAYRQAGTLDVGTWLRTIVPLPSLPVFDLRDPLPSLGNLTRVSRRVRGGAVPSSLPSRQVA